MMSFRDAKLVEIKRVMQALVADKTDASAEAYGLLHEYWTVVLCAKDGPAPAGPKESVRVPRSLAPEPSPGQPGALPEDGQAPPTPQPPAFKTWLSGVIKGDDSASGGEHA